MLCTIWFLHRIVFKSLESYPVWKNKAHHQAWQIKRWIYSRVGSFFFSCFRRNERFCVWFLLWHPKPNSNSWNGYHLSTRQDGLISNILKCELMCTHIQNNWTYAVWVTHLTDEKKNKIVKQFCDGFTSTSKMVAPERMKNHQIGCVFF